VVFVGDVAQQSFVHRASKNVLVKAQWRQSWLHFSIILGMLNYFKIS